MRYALIDNATLTGVQRLLGEIPVYNKSITDNDIVSFENYIQAILFYDNIISIDDYKPQHRQNRATYFPNIRFIPKEYFAYSDFIKAANEATKNISLEIRGGKITDSDFREYFNKLQMNFQFTWDQSSSKFFLIQKMLSGNSTLSHEHFSSLHAIINKEITEQSQTGQIFSERKPRLFDSQGNELEISDNGNIENSYSGDGLSKQFQGFVSSLNWLSQRTAFYVLTAEYLYADLILQPMRQSFMKNIIKKVYPQYNLGVFDNFWSAINHQSEDSIKSILKNTNNFSLSYDIPLMSAYFAKKTGNSKMIIDAALNEKDNKDFKEARSKLRELNLLYDNQERGKFIRELNLLITDIEKNLKKIESKYGLGEKQGFGISQLQFLFSSIPGIKNFKVPQELDYRIKELEFIKHLAPKKGFNAIYRSVIEDIVEFNQLGKYKDILIKNVAFDKNAESYLIKTENPKYVKASSYWKRPM